MDNLTQQQKEAKDAYLQRQQSEVLDRLKTADRQERKAVIRHIDGFLSSTTPEGKIFWLKIRERLERLNEQTNFKRNF